MATRIQLRNGTASEWTAANPVLYAGEAGVETDTHRLKVGDGATPWVDLTYVAPAPGATGGDDESMDFVWTGGAWVPAIPVSAPVGVRIFHFYGPSQPTGLPSYVGPNIAAGKVLATYDYAETS